MADAGWAILTSKSAPLGPSKTSDVVGGLTATEVGTPDRSVHATYGEAFAGAGPSLNTLIDGVNGGSGYLSTALGSAPNLALETISMCFDGALAGTLPLTDQGANASFVGDIFPTQDLQIGDINGGTNAGQAQSCGLDDLAFYTGLPRPADVAALAAAVVSPADFTPIGTGLCGPAVANSTGASGLVRAFGSDVALDDDVTLAATSLPMNSTGFFLTSQETNVVMNPGGSTGNICIASYAIGRYDATVLDSRLVGGVLLELQLGATPFQPGGPVAIVAGETWYWQYWYRDMDATGMPTSNFTDAVCVTFH